MLGRSVIEPRRPRVTQRKPGPNLLRGERDKLPSSGARDIAIVIKNFKSTLVANELNS
jgi:hypothetical protein